MLLKVHNLNKSFGQQKIIEDISFTLIDGQISCVLGPSGCGKSTLLRIIGGLEESSSGEVKILSDKTGYILQESRLLPWFTAYENVELVLKERIRNPETRKRHVENALSSVKLERFADYYPNDLSGGMKQRVAIARALVIEPELLLMDEPLSNLDFPLRLELIDLLGDIFADKKMGGVFVTHDNREALLLCDSVMIMDNNPGKIKNVIPIDLPRKSRSLASPELREVNRRMNSCLRLRGRKHRQMTNRCINFQYHKSISQGVKH